MNGSFIINVVAGMFSLKRLAMGSLVVVFCLGVSVVAHAEEEEEDYGQVLSVDSGLVTTTGGDQFVVADSDMWNEGDRLSATLDQDEEPVIITNVDTGAVFEQ